MRQDGIGAARRAVTLVAVALLLVQAHGCWLAATAPVDPSLGRLQGSQVTHTVGTLLAVAATAALLLLGIVAFGVRTRRWAAVVDAALLATGAVLAIALLVIDHVVSDEGVLTNRAAGALLSGAPVYDAPWPHLFTGLIPVTPTMDGGIDDTYGYPPGAVLLVAGFRAVAGHASIAPAAVGTVALLAIALTAWLAVPVEWRSLVTIIVLGVEVLPADARAGFPSVIALALLVPVLVRWHRIGEGGRLGRGGVLRGVLLGAACGTQQLAWFLVPFLLAGLLSLRLPEVGVRRTAGLLARFAAVAAGACVLLNAPFLLTEPVRWAKGMLLLLTQGAIPHGQGILEVARLATGGSGALWASTAAGLAALLGLLAGMLLLPERLAPALPLLPFAPFFVGPRSAWEYFLVFSCLWIVTALTVPRGAFDGAWRPLPVHTDRLGAALIALLLAPAAALVAVALLTPAPFVVRAAAARTAGGAVTEVEVAVANRSGTALRPHFLWSAGTTPSTWWPVRSGPLAVPPGATAHYVLRPPSASVARRAAGSGSLASLVVFTDRPATMTVTAMPAASPG